MSSGSNVIPRRARPGLAGPRPQRGTCLARRGSGDTTPCKVTLVILHGVVSSYYAGLYPQREWGGTCLARRIRSWGGDVFSAIQFQSLGMGGGGG